MDELIAIEIVINTEKRCKTLYIHAENQYEIQALNEASGQSCGLLTFISNQLFRDPCAGCSSR
jgi:hypothetical protein